MNCQLSSFWKSSALTMSSEPIGSTEIALLEPKNALINDGMSHSIMSITSLDFV